MSDKWGGQSWDDDWPEVTYRSAEDDRSARAEPVLALSGPLMLGAAGGVIAATALGLVTLLVGGVVVAVGLGALVLITAALVATAVMRGGR